MNRGGRTARAGICPQAQRRHAGAFRLRRRPSSREWAIVLDRFMVEAPRALAALFGASSGRGSVEPPQATTLFQAIGDCAGLTASIFASSEPSGRLMIILDERIDDLVVASAFGEASLGAQEERGARTAIETALIEAFARALGKALESAFSPFGALPLGFEKIVNLARSFRARKARSAGGRGALLVADDGRRLRRARPVAPGAAAALPQGARTRARGRRARRRQPLVSPDGGRGQADALASYGRARRLADEPWRNCRAGGRRRSAAAKRPISDAVRLECAGRGMFLCKLGQGEGRYRLELETPIAELPELMIEASGLGSYQFSAIERDPS